MEAKAEPPQKRKKKNPPSLSSLPDDILLNCLARISRSDYRSVSLVSKSISSLLSCPEIYRCRSRIGNTEPCLYVRQKLATYDRWYALDRTLITKGWIKDELSLSPIKMPSFDSGLSKSTIAAVGFEIYLMGGTKWPSSAVRVLNCRTHTWRDGPNMTVARKSAESCFMDGKIYVIGGTEESMNWAEVFDLKTQTWKLLPRPRPSGDVIVHHFNAGMLYVTSWNEKYEYDSQEGRWKEKVDGFGYIGKHQPCCVIDNVKFTVFQRSLRVLWRDSESKNWRLVIGLKDLEKKYPTHCSAVQLASYGGKLIILWEEPRPLEFPVAGKKKKHCCQNKKIWCAVIRLEKRIGEMWGEIERSDPVLTVPKSYEILTCITL